MTQAKLAPSPSDGHGLTDRITGPHYSAYSKGESIEYIPALVLLKVAGHGGHDTANGRVNTVKYEAVRLEPILEPSDHDDMLWKIQALYEARTSTGSQRPLPIGLAGEERRLALIERIEEWATHEDLSGGELEQMWRDHFGIGEDPEANLYGIPGQYEKASVAHLLQFAIETGAEKGDQDVDDDTLPTPDDDPLAADGSDDATGDTE